MTARHDSRGWGYRPRRPRTPAEEAAVYEHELKRATRQGLCPACARKTARATAAGRLSWLDRPDSPESSLCEVCDHKLNPDLVSDGWKTSPFTGNRVRTWRVPTVGGGYRREKVSGSAGAPGDGPAPRTPSAGRVTPLGRASQRKPESPAQARTWEKTKGTYIGLGLDERCAAMAAWGHQVGFDLADPPCPACRRLLEDLSLPRQEPNNWRALRRGDRVPGPDEIPGGPDTPQPGRAA
jgi:hypothetical protein